MSTRNILIAGATILVCALLSACCSSQPPDANEAAQHASPATAASGAKHDEILTVEPVNRQACNAKGPIVAVVRWKSSSPHVKIMETNPGEPTRLFSGGGFAGQATTGAWVVTETRFAMVDASTGATLATATIDRSSCGQ